MNNVAEIPRQKLKEIVDRNGEAVLHDPDRCEGLLKDHCGSCRREISALIGAMEERVPLELKSSWQTAMTPEAMRARLVQRLEDNRGLAPEIADWAVEAWSYALGIGLGRKSDRLDTVLAANTAPVAPVMNSPSANYGAASVATRVASDRPGGLDRAVSDLERSPAPVGLLATPQKKAGAGVIGLIALVVLVFALTRLRSEHTPAPAPPPADVVHHDQPAPAPPPPAPVVTPAIVVPAGTPIMVRLNQEVNSDDLDAGQYLDGTVAAPLTAQGNVVVPQGADAKIRVVNVDKAGKVSGQAQLQLELVQVSSGGKLYHLASFKEVTGPKQAVKAAERAGVGGVIGAGAGAVIGHLFHHAGKGAAAGGVAGAGVGAATSKPAPVKIEAEKVLQFKLNKAIPLKG